MSKKGLALTLATLMIWAVAVPAFGAVEPFPDVPQDHWAYEAVESLRVEGLVEGYPDGTFGGERTFTRYEMAMIFNRILERLVNWLEGREALLITSATGEVIAALGEEFAPELEQMGVSSADLGQLLLAMNARVDSLADQVAGLVAVADAAQQEAEEAAAAAARAEDRAYRARLAAENARSQANEANSVANRALAIALMSAGVDEAAIESMSAEEAVEAARQAAQRAQRLAADAESTALRALAVAEMGFAAEDAERAMAEAEQANERAYRARLAAQQAQALAEEAREIAERGLAIAELAYNNEDVKAAVDSAEQAADRAYRARLAAEDARSQAADAREIAERALAIAEMAGPGALDAAVEAQKAVEEARLAAQRAQRLAAGAESAAMIADAKADLAREEAAESLAVAREAHQLASDAMEEAFRQGELARSEAREAMDMARQADRLAYLAHLSAERALRRIDDVEDKVDEIAARPVLGGEVRVDFEEKHSNNADAYLDPRANSGDKVGEDKSDFTTSVALNATVEPADGVIVEGGIKLAADVFGGSRASDSDVFSLADLYVNVTTPGVLRSAYFGSVTGAQAAEGFSKYVLHGSKHGNNSGGAIIETQIGSLSSRIIATRKIDADNNDENIYGIASTLPLAQGMNVGFSYAFQGETNRATALGIFGETAGLNYDWTFAVYGADTAIDGSLGTNIGSLELGFDYYAIGDNFGVNPHLGKSLTEKDDNILAGRTAYTLNAALPFSFAKAVYEKGYNADLDDADNDFKDYQLVGVEDMNVAGFDIAGYFYTEERQLDQKAQANRFDVSRTVEFGLPLTFSFTQAAMNLDGWTNPTWAERTHRAIGVSVDDYALTETITLNAGYKMEDYPLAGDWKEPSKWEAKLPSDVVPGTTFEIDKRNTLSGSLALAATEALTLKAGYELAQHETNHGDVARTTTDLGADYTVTMYGADVTLGYGYQVRNYDVAGYTGTPRSTYSVGITHDLFGGTVDAKYKLVTGRGSDGLGKVDARDMMASLDYTYPVAEGMDFTLSGKWGSSDDNADAADDYYYASIKAGVGLKF